MRIRLETIRALVVGVALGVVALASCSTSDGSSRTQTGADADSIFSTDFGEDDPTTSQTSDTPAGDEGGSGDESQPLRSCLDVVQCAVGLGCDDVGCLAPCLEGVSTATIEMARELYVCTLEHCETLNDACAREFCPEEWFECTGSCQCGNRQCGSLACGVNCGECDEGVCSPEGRCVSGGDCDCDAVECGVGACADECGRCDDGETCSDGRCIEEICECGDRECGSLECGAECGECDFGWDCTSEGRCVEGNNCDCGSRECGAVPGCEEWCGECDDDLHCDYRGLCVEEIVCDCGERECGRLPCGSSCGVCAESFGCSTEGTCEACAATDLEVCCEDDVCPVDSCGIVDAPIETCGEFGCLDGECQTDVTPVCIPDCSGKVCGDDGCDGQCGECFDGEECNDDGLCECTPESYRACCGTRICEYDSCGNEGEVVGECSAAEDSIASCGSDPFGRLQCCTRTPYCSEGDLWVSSINCRQWPAGLSSTTSLHVKVQDCEDTSCTTDDSGARCGCVPDCDRRSCGSDGCNGVCGRCADGAECRDGRCDCIPDCDGKVCGADGCGGTCGDCPVNTHCLSDRSDCACDVGTVIDPSGTACLTIGGNCGSVSQYGYCESDTTWVWCDPIHGLAFMDCEAFGVGSCIRLDATSGACECGPVPSYGTCIQFEDGPAYEIKLECLNIPGVADVLTSTNCRARTGSSRGFCGHQAGYTGSACYCDKCLSFDAFSESCYDSCGIAAECRNPGGENTFACF